MASQFERVLQHLSGQGLWDHYRQEMLRYEGLPATILQFLWNLQRDGQALKVLLARGVGAGERSFLEYLNATLLRRQPVPVPANGARYAKYSPRALAILFAVGQRAEVLYALARQERTPLADPSDYRTLPRKLLTILWRDARDWLALEALWLRAGRLPVLAVTPDTPETVLGLLIAHDDQRLVDKKPFVEMARAELLRRYHLDEILRHHYYDEGKRYLQGKHRDKERKDALAQLNEPYLRAEAQFKEHFGYTRVPAGFQNFQDLAGVFAKKLWELLWWWDLDKYDSLDHALRRSVKNEHRDRLRRANGQPWQESTQDEIREVPEQLGQSWLQALEEQEHAQAVVENAFAQQPGGGPCLDRVVTKARLGVELREDELREMAVRNLESLEIPVDERSLMTEIQRMRTWLGGNPTGRKPHELLECFPCLSSVQSSKSIRNGRLLILSYLLEQEETEMLEGVREPETTKLAEQVRALREEIFRRLTGRGRQRSGEQAIVPLFADCEARSQKLLYALGEAARGEAEA